MKDKAVEYFMNGNLCSESIILAAIDEGLCGKSLLSCATAFSGGMGSGCLCGAAAGAQMIIGYIFGKENPAGNPVLAREKARQFVEGFMARNKVMCCRALSGRLEGAAKREHCKKLVADSAELLEELIKVKV